MWMWVQKTQGFSISYKKQQTKITNTHILKREKKKAKTKTKKRREIEKRQQLASILITIITNNILSSVVHHTQQLSFPLYFTLILFSLIWFFLSFFLSWSLLDNYRFIRSPLSLLNCGEFEILYPIDLFDICFLPSEDHLHTLYFICLFPLYLLLSSSIDRRRRRNFRNPLLTIDHWIPVRLWRKPISKSSRVVVTYERESWHGDSEDKRRVDSKDEVILGQVIWA